ncbi:MAG: hydantoinase/oxoprolinase family protein [Chloroflexi bacterium]|nr:hydantoinase/oxoprolinase family protein [Chloroflexota bacterium]
MYLVGVDIGGTFTDCVVVDEGGNLAIGKALSTPHDYSLGVIESIKAAGEDLGLPATELLRQTTLIAHGTTVGDNALLTRSGAATGLITTRGFEDTLLIMRGGMGRVAGLSETEMKRQSKTDKPLPIVPRTFIEGVRERIDYKGAVISPLSLEDVRQAVARLREKGVEAIAISLLWSFMNPAHEQAIRAVVEEVAPEVFVTCSHEVAPVLGEYERTSTVAINAYLGPKVSRYLDSLVGRLNSNGFGKETLVMQAYGGLVPVREAQRRPVATIESGPAAGVIASMFVGNNLGHKDIIAADMGGTTFKLGVVSGGKVFRENKPVYGRYHVLCPKMDIQSIGAGGGSIAWLEGHTGLLKVGPTSAGASPGPACYDLGGVEPTVTDADLLLGYYPDYLLGGKMRLNRQKALDSVGDRLAGKLAMDVTRTAAAIKRITDSQMSDLIRKNTVYRGLDPREFILYAYGGAGPLHAGAFCRELGIKKVVIPITASVNGALGLVGSDIVHEYQLFDRCAIPADPTRINSNFQRLEAAGLEQLSSDGVERENVTLERCVYLRYKRQTHELATPVPQKEVLTEQDMAQVYDLFETLYEHEYGKGSAYRDAGMEMVTFEVRAIGRLAKPRMARYPQSAASAGKALKAKRPVFWETEDREMLTAIYDFINLDSGSTIDGPSIIETPVTTIAVYPDQSGYLDEFKNVHIAIK